MFFHVQKMINPIVDDEPDPVAANALQEGLGGQFSEMRTMMHYLFQSFNFRGEAEPYRDLIHGIGTEEISHVELIATTINWLLDGSPQYQGDGTPGDLGTWVNRGKKKGRSDYDTGLSPRTPPALYFSWRRTSYRTSTFPEPSHVRMSMSRSETAGWPSKRGVPAPSTTGPIIRCSSSTRSLANRSFQRVRLPKTKMSLPVWRFSSATCS